MPFPANWPPTTGTGRKSTRIFVEGTATQSFEDNAYMFIDLVGASACQGIFWPFQALRFFNDGTADLYITFDGTNIHGIVRPSEKLLFEDRVESGFAVRTNPAAPHDLFTAYRVEGW